MNVLYIEDNQMDIDLTRRELSKNAPYVNLDVVKSLQQARDKFTKPEEWKYDLVLTDMHLPDGDGINYLEWLREKQISCATVLITGHGDEDVAVATLKSGVNDYISKSSGYLQKLPLVLQNAVNRYQASLGKKTNLIHVLYVEDNVTDIDLTLRHLSRYAPHIHLDVVNNPEELLALMENSVAREKYDVLLLDHRLQGLNALELMDELKLYHLNSPIILVTGHGDEEVAVRALKMGAADYVVKSTDYLYHLPSVIENAYNRNKLLQEQEALRASEERFRRLAENAPDVISRYVFLPEEHFEYVSPAAKAVLGYDPQEFYHNPKLISETIHPDDVDIQNSIFHGVTVTSQPTSIRYRHKDGHYIWVEQRHVPVYTPDGQLFAIETITRDITERKDAEQHIQQQMQRLSAMLAIDNAISASLDLNLTLNIVLEHVITQLDVDAASVLLLNQFTQTMRLSVGRGYSHDPIKSFNLNVGEGFPGRALKERKLIYSNDPRDFQNPIFFNPEMRKEGFVAGVWVPLISKGNVKAILEVFSRREISADREWLDYLNMLASQTAIAVDNAELLLNLQRSNDELLLAYDSTLEGWVRALDLRNKEEEGHSQRVTDIATQLALRMGVRTTDLEHFRRGALLHDIGKLGVAEGILLKPGSLTEVEWQEIRKHPQYARQLIKPIGYLRKAMDIPYYHHEHWDGTGYPEGLQEVEIPLSARIFAVVDVWDAMTHSQPYRPALSEAEARAYIEDQQGKHFDPRVAAEFLRMLDEDLI